MMFPRPLWRPKTVAVLATKHGKERAIAPLLEDHLALRVGLAIGLDTDRFGTFTREIARTGSQLDAARAKIAAGFEYAPYARVGIASEGSFGPHTAIPFLPLGRELVLLIDRETGLELSGHNVGDQTNYDHKVVSEPEGAVSFAESIGFPAHGLIVAACVDGQPAPSLAQFKDIADWHDLEAAVRSIVSAHGSAFVETDMRAYRNPTRMIAIGRATLDLVRRFKSQCPACGCPGFHVIERVRGLPCAWCGEATSVVRSETLGCRACDHRKERRVGAEAFADPGRCGYCNP